MARPSAGGRQEKPSKGGANPARQRLRSDLIAFGAVAALLAGVTFLPPDTTLAQVRESGILRVCVPDGFPPLVTRDPVMPGIEMEILQHVADDLGVRLLTVTNSAIGRDFNPRNWRVTRAQCLILAGGVVDTTVTRSFLVVSRSHLETGWAAVHTPSRPLESLEGARVGFFAGLTGLDRLGLSSWLRSQGAVTSVVSNLDDARAGIRDGRFDLIVTEALTARRLAEDLDGVVTWLPVAQGRVPLAFGMWKGDLTLERAVNRSLARIRSSGTLAELAERYELMPVDEVCAFCR